MDPGTDRAWAGDVACCGVNNRGVALWKDKVISIALDGRLFAINKATGEVAWERKIADPAIGETLTIAPLVIGDVAIVGTAGGEFGIRGFIEATDLNTGKQAWRTYTIPGTGEPGNETWKDGKDHWKHGGGSVWETATYDPQSDTFYQGVGNAGPDWDTEYRPGDNKWAASVLALSPRDGKIKWGYQYTTLTISTKSPSTPSSTQRSTVRTASSSSMRRATASSTPSTVPTALSSPASNTSTS
jgi:alcohol dehydrogenase (cytochrome c)